jgi:hypothetical protein
VYSLLFLVISYNTFTASVAITPYELIEIGEQLQVLANQYVWLIGQLR